jgi:hypothetical protein
MFDDEGTITIVSSLKYIHSTVNRNFVTYVYIYIIIITIIIIYII